MLSFVISFGLWVLSSHSAWAVVPVGHAAPSQSTLHWSFDRTATDSRWDIARGAQHQPLLTASDDVWRLGISGISAGGEVRVLVASYQLWLLANPSVTDRQEIPSNTERFAATFRISFLGKAGIVGTTEVTTREVLASVDPIACESIECLERHNPSYFPLRTAAVRVPMSATAIEVELISVTDSVSGSVQAVALPVAKVAVTYHGAADLVHLVGLESAEPHSPNRLQFALAEPFPIRQGQEIEFYVGDVKNGRPFSMLYFNSAPAKEIEQIPVCYDEMNPSRVHYADRNDVVLVNQVMHVREDFGAWQTISPSSPGKFRFRPSGPGKLQFNFAFSLKVNLRAGLSDPNRCYQLGSGFKWVPAQPGLTEVAIGSAIDAPHADPTVGWEVSVVQ